MRDYLYMSLECEYCGLELDDTDTGYCSHCGAPIDDFESNLED